MRPVRVLCGLLALVCVAAPAASAARGDAETAAWPRGTAVVHYASPATLDAALGRAPAQVVRRIPALGIAEVRPRGSVAHFAALASKLPGITRVERSLSRMPAVEPALAPSLTPGGAYQWQYAATRAPLVSDDVLRAAQGITIAIVDTGADLGAPDLAAKAPTAWSVRTRTIDVSDVNGHGTFVASLAAGSVTNGDGIAGAGGDAKLMIVQAGGPDGAFTDVQEAAAIVYAVDHGARIVNLSLGGPDTSMTERKAIEYAVAKGVLLVAAVGNDFTEGNPIEYPAALLQPIGSKGVGGTGLAVGASSISGARASFSNTGSHLSLVAPGERVFGAVSSLSPAERYPRVALPGSVAGMYGFGSGTSFASPQVAGAAALVWAANPSLSAADVATVIEQSASGRGSWTPEVGFGVLDIASAVARARGEAPPADDTPVVRINGRREGRRVSLTWSGPVAAAYRVSMAQDSGVARVLTPSTTSTSASYSLVPGSDYTFTVAALDATGVATAVSEPWRVSLLRARTSLSLKASKLRGKAPLRIQLTARLASARQPGGAAGHTLVLESFGGGAWSPAARATTNATGRVQWQYTLARGAYRVRARLIGDDEHAPAISAPLDLLSR